MQLNKNRSELQLFLSAPFAAIENENKKYCSFNDVNPNFNKISGLRILILIWNQFPVKKRANWFFYVSFTETNYPTLPSHLQFRLKSGQICQMFSMETMIWKWSTKRQPSRFEKFQGNLCFQDKRKLLKNPEWLKIYSMQWKISGQLCFSGQAKVAQKSWTVKSFNAVYLMYIHLGVIHVIWASVVCNLHQSRDWL